MRGTLIREQHLSFILAVLLASTLCVATGSAQSRLQRKIDEQQTRCNSGRRTACDELLLIAHKCANEHTLACDIVSGLEDQPSIARIAEDAGLPQEIRAAAVSKLTDVQLLSGIAARVEDNLIRSFAESDIQRAKIGTLKYDRLDCESAMNAVKMLTVPESMSIAFRSINHCAYAAAFEKLQELPDEQLKSLETDRDTQNDYKESSAQDTIASLSGFLKHHPDSVLSTKVMDGLWNLLLREFPPDRFTYGLTHRQMWYPDQQGYNLFAAIRTGRTFLLEFAPKKVTSQSVPVYFIELAGVPVVIDTYASSATKPDGSKWWSPSASITPIRIAPYGRGEYTWAGWGWPRGTKFSFEFQDSNMPFTTRFDIESVFEDQAP